MVILLALAFSLAGPAAQAAAGWPAGIDRFQKTDGNCAAAAHELKPSATPRTEETCRAERLRAQLESAPEALCPGVEAKSIDVCFDRILGSMIDKKLIGGKSVALLSRAPLLWWFERENPDSVSSALKLVDIDRAALRNYERVAPAASASADEKLFPHFILHHWEEQLDHAAKLGGKVSRDEFKKAAARWNFVAH